MITKGKSLGLSSSAAGSVDGPEVANRFKLGRWRRSPMRMTVWRMESRHGCGLGHE